MQVSRGSLKASGRSPAVASSSSPPVTGAFMALPPLKLVRQPAGHIVNVLSRPAFLQEPTSEEMAVNRDECQVAVDIPGELRLGHAADKAGPARTAGTDGHHAVVVQPVTAALPPEKIPVEQEPGPAGEMEAEARVEVDEVGR